MKRCSHCRQFKLEEEFYKNRSKKDGLSLHCKICHDKSASKSKALKKGMFISSAIL